MKIYCYRLEEYVAIDSNLYYLTLSLICASWLKQSKAAPTQPG